MPFAFRRRPSLAEDWWKAATTGLRGVTARHERQVAFVARQLLDVLSPSNFPWSNPEVVRRTVEEGGLNLLRGLGHWLEDAEAQLTGQAPRADGHVVGRDVA